MKPTKYIWKNGQFIEWENATTHVLSHALHYGTAVFEGVRAYSTSNGPAIFRGKDHFDRLLDSAKIYLMDCPYSADALLAATRELISKNELSSCYIRPLMYYGYKEMGIDPKNNPVETIIAAWEWGTYLGEDGIKNGVRCKISSWNRIDSRSMPPLAKASGNYINSVLAKQEALSCGYDEAILLNINGTIAEGPGENIFLVKDEILYTPPISDNVLKGITHNTVLHLAHQMKLEVRFESLIRDQLFLADELFFTGTAAEVTPIREIDNRKIGNGSRGPITETIQTAFFEMVKGNNPNASHWLD